MLRHVICIILVYAIVLSPACRNQSSESVSHGIDPTVSETFNKLNAEQRHAVSEIASRDRENFEKHGWELYRYRKGEEPTKVSFDTFIDDMNPDKHLSYYVVPNSSALGHKLAYRRLPMIDADNNKLVLFIEAYDWSKKDLKNPLDSIRIAFDFGAGAAEPNQQVAENDIVLKKFADKLAKLSASTATELPTVTSLIAKHSLFLVGGLLVGAIVYKYGVKFIINKRTNSNLAVAGLTAGVILIAASIVAVIYAGYQLYGIYADSKTSYGRVANRIKAIGASTEFSMEYTDRSGMQEYEQVFSDPEIQRDIADLVAVANVHRRDVHFAVSNHEIVKTAAGMMRQYIRINIDAHKNDSDVCVGMQCLKRQIRVAKDLVQLEWASRIEFRVFRVSDKNLDKLSQYYPQIMTMAEALNIEEVSLTSFDEFLESHILGDDICIDVVTEGMPSIKAFLEGDLKRFGIE